MTGRAIGLRTGLSVTMEGKKVDIWLRLVHCAHPVLHVCDVRQGAT